MEQQTHGITYTVSQIHDPGKPTQKKFKILHIDDDESLLYLSKKIIENQDPKFIVTSVTDPKYVLENHSKFDCIISDYQMPEMNGIELAEALRKISETPFVLYTGQGSEEVAEKGFQVGIDDYLRKEMHPAHYHVLTKRILSLVQRKRAENKLIEKSKELTDMFVRSLDAIFQVDIRRGVTWFNPAFQEIYGFSKEELSKMGMGIIDCLHEDDRAQFQEDLNNLVTSKMERYTSLNRWITKQGLVVWLESNIMAIKEDGKFIGVNIIARNVTKRMQAELDLRASNWAKNERLKELTCLYYIDRLLADSDFTIHEIFQKVVDIVPSGWQYSEVSEARIIFEGEIYGSSSLGSQWSQVAEIRVNDVVKGFLEVYYLEEKPEFDEGPFLLEERELVNTLAENIGKFVEKQHLKAELRESEERYKNLIDNASDIIQSVNLDGRFVFVNKSFEDVLGYSFEEVEKMNVFDIIHSDHLEHCMELFSKVIAGETVKNIKTVFVAKDGKSVSLEGNAVPRILDGKVIATHSFFHEVRAHG